MLGSNEIDVINSLDIYDIYEDLYLSKKELEEKLLQGIQSENSLKVWAGVKKNRWHCNNSYNQRKCNQKDF